MKNEKRVIINGESYAPRVIFDNGGGIAVQLPEYTHHYDDAEQAADDVAEWIKNEDTSDWDGNEPEMLYNPGDKYDSGWTTWAIGDDIDDDQREWGYNTESFFAALELKTVVGKTLAETDHVDFGTFYPLVARGENKNPNAKIIGVVCAEDGSVSDGIEYDHDGVVAWPVD